MTHANAYGLCLRGETRITLGNYFPKVVWFVPAEGYH